VEVAHLGGVQRESGREVRGAAEHSARHEVPGHEARGARVGGPSHLTRRMLGREHYSFVNK
jgi:hypothetical protein